MHTLVGMWAGAGVGEYYCWKTGILNNWGCFIGPGVSTDHCLDTFIIWTRPLNLTLICWTLELNLRFELWFALKLKLNLWFELWFAEKFEQDIWFELWFAIYFEPDLWFELWFAIKFELDLWFELWFVMKLKLDLWFELWFDWKFSLCPALGPDPFRLSISQNLSCPKSRLLCTQKKRIWTTVSTKQSKKRSEFTGPRNCQKTA